MYLHVNSLDLKKNPTPMIQTTRNMYWEAESFVVHVTDANAGIYYSSRRSITHSTGFMTWQHNHTRRKCIAFNLCWDVKYMI